MAQHVTVMLDEASDINNKSQLATTLRYVHDKTAKIEQTLISCMDISAAKLVTQTYDEATVLTGD